MNNDRQYFKVGIFVILSSLLLIASILFFGAARYLEPTIYVESYFDESIQGLDVGSPVKYRGITIGHISQISMLSSIYTIEDIKNEEIFNRDIYIKMAITKDKVKHFDGKTAESNLAELVKSGLRIRIVSQGFTGTSYLEMTFLNPKDNPLQKIEWAPSYLYLPSAASTYTRFTDAMEDIFNSLEKVNFEKIFNDIDSLATSANEAIKKIDLPALSKELTTTLTTMQKTFTRYQKLANNLNSAIDKDQLNDIMTNIEMVTEKANETFGSLSQTVNHTDQLLLESQSKIVNILDNTESATANIKAFSMNMKEYPTQMIWGNPPPKLNLTTIK